MPLIDECFADRNALLVFAIIRGENGFAGMAIQNDS